MHDQQYNVVVAQNKSLQGELRLYKKMVNLMAKEIAYYTLGGLPTEAAFDFIKDMALQELEAEND